jgi:Parkin co-regulated protein
VRGARAGEGAQGVGERGAACAGFLKKGTGAGGTLRRAEGEEGGAAGGGGAGAESKEGEEEGRARSARRPQRATAKRTNPANTDFRKFYERGVVPVCVAHTSAGIRAHWKSAPGTLDYHFFLPVFMSGLREVEEPFLSLGLHGTLDLVTAAPDKVQRVVPQLAVPVHQALTTRDPAIVRRVLLVLQTMVKAGAAHGVGEALVPYFRQILPILNIFKERNESTGDGIVYGQRKVECLGDLINETLQLLELYGGEFAFVNIRYFVPTYESVIPPDPLAPPAPPARDVVRHP